MGSATAGASRQSAAVRRIAIHPLKAVNGKTPVPMIAQTAQHQRFRAVERGPDAQQRPGDLPGRQGRHCPPSARPRRRCWAIAAAGSGRPRAQGHQAPGTGPFRRPAVPMWSYASWSPGQRAANRPCLDAAPAAQGGKLIAGDIGQCCSAPDQSVRCDAWTLLSRHAFQAAPGVPPLSALASTCGRLRIAEADVAAGKSPLHWARSVSVTR